MIKTHTHDFAMQKINSAAKGTAWLFVTSTGTGNEKKEQLAKYTQSLKELNAKGPAMAGKYAELLGLTPSETADLQAYMQRWDALRLCCGKQMSQSYRDHLQNKTSSHVMRGGIKSDHSQYCSSLDLDTVEQELMATAVFQHGKDLTNIARNTAREPPFTGTYCTEANRIIAEHHLQFNELPQPYMSNASQHM